MNHGLCVSFFLAAVVSQSLPAQAADLTGREVFDHYCTACHGTADGPATQQLGRTRGPDKALLLQRTDLAPVYVEYVVRHGLKSMPPFVPSDLTDAKLKVLVNYLVSPLPR